MIDYSKMLSRTLCDIKPSGIRKFFDMLSDIDIELPEFELPDLDLFDFYW